MEEQARNRQAYAFVLDMMYVAVTVSDITKQNMEHAHHNLNQNRITTAFNILTSTFRHLSVIKIEFDWRDLSVLAEGVADQVALLKAGLAECRMLSEVYSQKTYKGRADDEGLRSAADRSFFALATVGVTSAKLRQLLDIEYNRLRAARGRPPAPGPWNTRPEN